MISQCACVTAVFIWYGEFNDKNGLLWVRNDAFLDLEVMFSFMDLRDLDKALFFSLR